MRPFGTPEELERRRLRALDMLREGCAPAEVARRLSVDRRSVYRWRAAIRNQGFQAIQARPAPGRPPRFDAATRLKIQAALIRGPRAAGFLSSPEAGVQANFQAHSHAKLHGQFWTYAGIADLIEKAFGIQYHPDHIARLLRRLGFSQQTPAPSAVHPGHKPTPVWVHRGDPPKRRKQPTRRSP